MTDRQPGAPGQYMMTVKETGETFAVTLTRDDQPIVEGTPYNKASVLPDVLAQHLCPAITDPTPADALEGLRKKKYSATLYSGQWAETAGQYTQTVLISEIKGDESESVRCWPVYSGIKEDDEEIRDAAAEILFAKTSAGRVTFTCPDGIPGADIPIKMEVSR